MSRNRIGRTVAAGALLAGAWGAFSTARAQASGTLQASVTVIDDPVNRAIAAGLPAYLSLTPEDSLFRPQSLLVDRGALRAVPGVRATVRELRAERSARRLRIDVVYLQ